MFAIKRNQVIIAALVVMIAIAGYLNYLDSTNPELPVASGSDESESTYYRTVFDNTTGQEVAVINNGITAPLDGEIGIALTDEDDFYALTDESEITVMNSDDTSGQAEESNTQNNEEPGTAVFVNNSNDSSYFIQAKLDREQARSKRKEILTELMNNNNVDKDKKAECATEILDIQDRIEKETTAEAMIEAKGFAEAYVRIDPETVDVVVSKTELTDAEIAQITDIVTRKTGYESSQVRISPKK